MSKETILVETENGYEERKVDYHAYRSKDEQQPYPVLKAYEHIYENENGFRIFKSIIK